MKLSFLSFVLLVISKITFCSGQFFYHQQLATASQPYANQSVVANSVLEDQLPPELSKVFFKNPYFRFFNNPYFAASLAKESWFTDKEMPVLDREAEKIPRDMVYNLFKNTGYIKRR